MITHYQGGEVELRGAPATGHAGSFDSGEAEARTPGQEESHETPLERLQFEGLLSDISLELVRARSPEDIESTIEHGLQRTVEFFGSSNCVLIRAFPDVMTAKIVHTAYVNDAAPLPVGLDIVPYFPWTSKLMREGRQVRFVNVDDLPDEAAIDRKTYLGLSIRSALSIPLFFEGSFSYGIFLSSRTDEREWREEHVRRLQLLGDILVNALWRKDTVAQLEERLRFEQLLSDISARFANTIPFEEIDGKIDRALGEILAFFEVDRCALLQTFPDKNSWQATHAAMSPDVPPLLLRKRFPVSIFQWSYDCLRKGEVLCRSSLDELPPEAAGDKQTYIEWGIRSFLDIPILTEGPSDYAISLNSCKKEVLWPEEHAVRLRLLGEIFVHALERRRTEEAITESRLRIAAIVENTDDLIWSVDPERFGLLTFNNALRRYFRQGVGIDIFLGMTPDQMISGTFTPEFAAQWRQLYLKALHEGPFTQEYKVSSADRVLLLSLSLLKRSGEIFGISVFGKDITERKKLNEEIRRSAEEWQTTFDSIQDAVTLLDRDYRIVRANKPALALYGLSAEEALGKYCFQLMHGQEEPPDICPVSRMAVSKTHEEAEIHDGRRRAWFHVSSDPIFDKTGQIARIIHVVKDITDRKKAEAEAFGNLRETLRFERLLRMGELSASLAHELNQPLTSILSNARAAIRFLEAGKVDLEEIKEILGDIARDDKRAGDIVRSLRSMVKMEEGGMEPAFVPDLLHQAMALFKSEAIIRNIKIDIDASESLPQVMVNKVQINQLVINLTMNGVEAMENNPIEIRRISIKARFADNCVQISFRDSGTGIRTSEMDRLFEPFFTTKASGLGMGLSLSRSIVEAHNGHIWAENNPDRGATFHFSLPVMKS